MDLQFYDFESGLEQGFKTLFVNSGIEIRTADDVDEGELPDECLTLQVDAGGVNSNEHLNSEGVYDNYTGELTIVIKSNRVSGDRASTDSSIRNRHSQLVAIARKTLEEIDNATISANWPNLHAPTKIKPTGTDRENDKLSKMTTLSYELQFRIT